MKYKRLRNVRQLPSGVKVAELDIEYKRFFFFIYEETEVVYLTANSAYWRSLPDGKILHDSVYRLYNAYTVIQELQQST